MKNVNGEQRPLTAEDKAELAELRRRHAERAPDRTETEPPLTSDERSQLRAMLAERAPA